MPIRGFEQPHLRDRALPPKRSAVPVHRLPGRPMHGEEGLVLRFIITVAFEARCIRPGFVALPHRTCPVRFGRDALPDAAHRPSRCDTVFMKGNTRRRRLLSLLLLAASLPLLAGCRFGEKRRTFSPPDTELLRAKADPRLRQEAETGGTEPFAAIAVFRNDVFLDQSEALGRSSLPILNELGNSAILLLYPAQ